MADKLDVHSHHPKELPPAYPASTMGDDLPDYRMEKPQGFVFVSKLLACEVFTFKDSADLDRKGPVVPPPGPDYDLAIKSLEQSIGLPVVVEVSAKRGTPISFLSRPLFASPEIKEPAIATLPTKVPFSLGEQRRIGEVSVKNCRGYLRYEVQTESGILFVLRHHKMPIFDFKIDDNRYRFLRSTTWGERTFKYDLYLLDAKQPSLVDEMDAAGNAHKDNPLISKHVRNPLYIFRWEKSTKDCKSPHLLGSFEGSWGTTQRMPEVQYSTFTTSASSTNADRDDVVEPRVLSFIYVALLVRGSAYVERRITMKRENSSSSGGGGVVWVGDGGAGGWAGDCGGNWSGDYGGGGGGDCGGGGGGDYGGGGGGDCGGGGGGGGCDGGGGGGGC